MHSSEIRQKVHALAADLVRQQPGVTMSQWMCTLNRSTTDAASVEVVSMVLAVMADTSRAQSRSASNG